MRRISAGWLTVLVCAALAVLLAPPAAAIGVVSIDYGTEWIKAALVKPGMPFDVVLSRDSKRKVQSTVAFKGKVPADGNLAKQERLLGGDAYAFASRNPLQTYHAAKLLLGQSCNDTESSGARLFERVFGNDMVPLRGANVSGSSCVVRPSPDNEAFWRPEEIVGMELDHIRELAEDTAGEMLSIGFVPGSQGYFSAQKGLDTVITVPIYFTALERQALFDSAILAGFRPHLISDGAAAAANYAQSRSFPKPEHHVFFDVGSGASRATLVELSEQPSAEARGKAVTNVRVLDAAWSREVGGLTFDLLVRDLLADAFDRQHGAALATSVRDDKRAMARLLREANRVKHVLSANAEASSYVESLAHDLDLRTSVTREQFERAMEDAGQLARVVAPIHELLQRTRRTVADIDSVVLIGGSTRVPAVQAALRAAGVPEEKIAVNVNADEAPVMGAALYAANMQPALRMKQVNVTDGNMYPVSVAGFDTPAPRVAFPAGAVPADEALLERSDVTQDFGLTIAYTPEAVARLPSGYAGPLAHVELDGITETLQELGDASELRHVQTKVNATLRSSPAGVYVVANPTLLVTPKTTIAGALKAFFKLDEPSTTNATDANATDATQERVVPLTQTVEWLTNMRPLNAEDKLKALERLRLIVHEAKERVKKDTASNQLEALLYQARELLDDAQFTPYAAERETKQIRESMEQASTFLADGVEEAAAATVEKKYKDFKKLLDTPRLRAEEAARRPASSAALRAVLDDGAQFVAEARANLTAALKAQQSSKYSVTELDSLQSQVEGDRKWLADGERAQAARKLYENAVVRADEMDRRAKKLRDTLGRLRRRRIAKTRPPKKETTTTSATESATESATASESATQSTTPTSRATPAESSTAEPPLHTEL